MRRIGSFGSVKVISLNRDEMIRHLREVATSAPVTFPHLRNVYLIGSLASGSYSGTSNVDLLLQFSEQDTIQSRRRDRVSSSFRTNLILGLICCSVMMLLYPTSSS